MYICIVLEDITIRIITHSEDLPEMTSAKFFHSPELFRIVEQSPGQAPYMAVAIREGRVIAHLLAILRRRGSLIPPYLFTQGRVYGEGEYDEDVDREEVFRLMLEAITRKLRRRLCFYIEFSDLSTKMFAYRHFRACHYFPVQWLRIHNSLHSMPPEERLGEKTLAHIKHGQLSGVTTKEVETDEEFEAYYNMLRRFFTLKVRRYLPPEEMFRQLAASAHCKLYVTLYKGKVIGGCAVVLSEGNAHLWYLASLRKSHHHLHPGTMTVWHALSETHSMGLRHFYFMDAGLPFRKSKYKDLRRDFVLRFGGKPVSTYRWFRCTLNWLNRILTWLWKE